MQISQKPRHPTENLVELLLECHDRIRRFAAMAIRVGGEINAPHQDVVAACKSCKRYFDEALPLHVRDEEESIEPRLRNARPDCAARLDETTRQHVEHAPLLVLLSDTLRDVKRSPSDTTARARLLSVATKLAALFDEHLTLEENVVFPAIRDSLSHAEQQTIISEIRARRENQLT